MAPLGKVLSGGDHPIYLVGCGSDDEGSAKVVAHDEADGSQEWSESHDDSALSSVSDDQALSSRSDEEGLGASPPGKQLRANNRLFRRTQKLLGSELASKEAHSQRNACFQSLEQSESDSDSVTSSSGDDSGLERNLEVGQQFQDGNGPIPGFIDDSDLDAVVSTD